MYWSPNFLAVVFKSKKLHILGSPLISTVVTRMQDIAFEFSNILGGDTPDVHSGRRRPPPAPNTQPGLWRGTGHKRHGVGTQTLVPLNFSAMVAPLATNI